MPPPLVLGFCLFLVGANYYYAQRATYLLDRIRDMPLNDSAAIELKTLGSEHGFRYEEATNCENSPCINMVAPNNLWMHYLLTSRFTAWIGRILKLRAWLAVGDIELEKHEVIGNVYGLAFFEGQSDPEMEVTAWEERTFDPTSCPHYPRDRHSGYCFWNANNIRFFKAKISSDTSSENREHAFQFNLLCLRSGYKCDHFSDLMPAAWADYEEDAR